MNRFYLPPERITEDLVTFTPEQRKQLRNVLRLQPGSRVSVFDGSGAEYLAEIASLDDREATAVIISTSRPDTEPPLRLTLIQGIPKGEKIDLILQKCTEIGVARFLIAETERSITHIPPAKVPDRLDRWRSIVREAAEQSGRVLLPTVEGVLTFKQALTEAQTHAHALIADPTAAEFFEIQCSMLDIRCSIAVLIGPEGGFTPKELDSARSAGITPVSLGPRILRTETAAVVASALAVFR